MIKINKKITEWKVREASSGPNPRNIPSRPSRLQAETKKIKLDTGDGVRNAYITVSFYPDSKDPYEVFINTPIGNNLKDLQILELSARMTSLALRHGVPVKHIINQLNKIDGQYIYSIPVNLSKALQSYMGKDDILEEDSEAAVEVENLTDEELDQLMMGEEEKPQHSSGIAGEVCPKCKNNGYIVQEGCGRCFICGHSRCE